MIVGVCGYGYTGSGAVLDLLKEYENIQVNDNFEFTISYWPDGIEDLEYHIMKQNSRFFSSDLAIMRFKAFIKKEIYAPRSWYRRSMRTNEFNRISQNYIKAITQITWDGRWMIDPYLRDGFIQSIMYRALIRIAHKIKIFNKLLKREMNFSIKPNNFYIETRVYINKILEGIGNDLSKTIVLDQPFPANCPAASMSFFEDSKAIIVDRDPRDLYILVKVYSKAKWVPTYNVKAFISYYKQLRLEELDSQRILYIAFEDLIYKYEETVRKISGFCECGKQLYPFKYFDPNISKSNTLLYLQHPEYLDDINEIENELKGFLYNYPSDIKHYNLLKQVF